MNRFRSMFFSIQIFRALTLAAASGRRGSAFWRTKGCGTSCENTASCGFNHLRWHPHRDPIFPIFPNIPSPLNHHRCLSPFLLIYGFERIIIFRLICDALGSTFPKMKFHEISLKITSKFIRFFYNGWSTTVIHSPKRMNKQLFFFIERKDFRDRRRTNLFELRVYVRLLKRFRGL